MPWWALILAIVWLALGLVDVWIWQNQGDGKLAFLLRFFTGIIAVPAFLALLMLWNIQDRMALRKKRKEPSEIPAVH